MQTWLTMWRGRQLTVRVHYTWILLLILGSWSLSRFALPVRLGEGGWLWTTALLVMTAYLGCVMVHEAGHLVAAKLLGVPIPVLNVHPIGTLARRGTEAAGPARTAAVAAAGPLANLALWVILRALSPMAGSTSAVIVEFATWFTWLLAFVNLLPGLPLDGGRILRAAVWSASTFTAGTRIATRAGYVVSAGILVFGLRALGTAETMLRGVWLILLAWLIYAAGAALAQRRTVGQLFNRLRARDILAPPPYVIGPHATLRELVALWQGDTGENPTPVVHEGALIGLIGRSEAYDVPQGYWDERTVGMTMRPLSEIATIDPDTPLSEVLPRVDLDPFHPAPLLVAADGQLIGLIDAREIEPLLDVHEVFGMPAPAAAPWVSASKTDTAPARPLPRTVA